MTKLEIRQATLTDIPAAQEIRERTLPAEHQYRYERNIRSPGCLNFVACTDGHTVGYISVLKRASDPAGAAMWQRLGPYVGFVGVLPEYRRQGICRQLVEASVGQLRSSGLGGDLYLECDPTLCPLYERLGFVVVDADVMEQAVGLRPKADVMKLALTSADNSNQGASKESGSA